jgi:hypothetical protein
MPKQKVNLYADFGIIALSVLIALIFAESRLLIKILSHSSEFEILGSFVAGFFFTSIFTTAPSIVVLAELGNVQNPFVVAFVGALGSLAGDLILFRFFKNSVARDLEFMVQKIKLNRWHIFHSKFFTWLVPFIGALIIASPLPDELGIGMMGIAKLKTSKFIPISYALNFLGILIITGVF